MAAMNRPRMMLRIEREETQSLEKLVSHTCCSTSLRTRVQSQVPVPGLHEASYCKKRREEGLPRAGHCQKWQGLSATFLKGSQASAHWVSQ